ncbi:MAG: MipA/OmpV family protein [Pseudomonadota bacterium]
MAQAQLGAGYGRNIGERLRLNTNVGLTVVDDQFADTYFSVSQDDAFASGLARFAADGGIKDYGANLTATYRLSERWSAVGFASYRRLVGDAVESPIVDREGDPNQVIFALGVGYAF